LDYAQFYFRAVPISGQQQQQQQQQQHQQLVQQQLLAQQQQQLQIQQLQQQLLLQRLERELQQSYSCLRQRWLTGYAAPHQQQQQIAQQQQLFAAQQLQSSMCAGLTASVLSTPADVIKSRMMNQPVDESGKNLYYKNSIDCLRKLIREEGALTLYKGLMPTWFRLGPFSVLFWLSVEQLRQWEGQVGF